MSAFRKSVELAVDGIELDIQRAASGELVVFHDSDLGRTTNGAGLVKDASFAELRRLSAGLWYDKEFAEERIPLLEEVLDLVEGKLVINIEIKNTPYEYPGIDDDLIALLDQYLHQDKVIVSSFDHNILRSFHKKAANIKTACLGNVQLVDIGEYAAKFGAKYWHPCQDSLLASGVQEAHDAGMVVNVWTVNTARDWSRCLSLGVDGIITDDPVGLTQFLKRR